MYKESRNLTLLGDMCYDTHWTKFEDIVKGHKPEDFEESILFGVLKYVKYYFHFKHAYYILFDKLDRIGRSDTPTLARCFQESSPPGNMNL